MIERASEHGAAPVPAMPQSDSGLSAGQMLRAAREAHDLDLDVVAAALKITPQKLAALEADDIDSLPDPVFARALAASIARALRIDPAPVLAKLPGARTAGLAQTDRTLSGSLRPEAPRANGAAGKLPSRALLGVVGLLLVGAAALFWLPQSVFDRLGASISRLSSSGESAAAAGDGPAPASAPGNSVEPTAAPAAPAAAVVAPAVEPPPTAPPVVAATDRDLIVFSVREDAWITVDEAGGKSLLKRTVQAGETVSVGGKPPLVVVVGRASGVQVQVRGKPFDLARATRPGGVARFEVKP